MKRTLIAMVARHVVNHAGLLAVRRPDVCWTAYAGALRNGRPIARTWP